MNDAVQAVERLSDGAMTHLEAETLCELIQATLDDDYLVVIGHTLSLIGWEMITTSYSVTVEQLAYPFNYVATFTSFDEWIAWQEANL